MKKEREEERWCVYIDKKLAAEFRKRFVNYKGDLSTHVENALKLYIDFFEGRTHIFDVKTSYDNVNVTQTAQDAAPQPTAQAAAQPFPLPLDHEASNIVSTMASHVSVGAKVPERMLFQMVMMATGLVDRRSIKSRILKLEALGVVRRDPKLTGVYEVVSLNANYNYDIVHNIMRNGLGTIYPR